MFHSSKFAVVFPGQGSQKVNMLIDHAKKYPQIKQTFLEAQTVLGYDLEEILQDSNLLNQSSYTQPIMLAAGIALWRILNTPYKISPAYLLGHSLGEYTALVAAGVISFSDALKLVAYRGQIMQQAVVEAEGGMVAVMGLELSSLNDLCEQINQRSLGTVQPANYNAPSQTVVAGHKQAIMALIDLVKQQGGKALLLPMSVPSHCTLMEPAARLLGQKLQSISFSNAAIPVITNNTARPISNAHELKIGLIQQLTSPVRWLESEQYLVSQDITQLIECGPGNALTGLAKRMPPLNAYATNDIDQLPAILLNLHPES